MKAIAPGKLILSGEHAVVHGRPALVIGVDRHARATVTAIDEDMIRVSFPGVFGTDSLPTAALHGLKKRLLDNYSRFLTGDLGIRHVLTGPAELLYYAVIHLLDETQRPLKGGLRMELETDLPVGCGMGSSAAVIAATLGATAAELGLKPDRDALYRWTLEVERMQHGHPSGVDPFITVHGGCVRFQQGEAVPLPLPRKELHLALTGVPESTTGECVAQVSQRFPMNDPIWPRFERIADEMEQAFRDNAWADVRAAIRANHRLLCEIGVVPDRVAAFIEEIEAKGGAAKICGAGAITGHAAGVVLVIGDDQLGERCARYEYDCFPVHADDAGLTLQHGSGDLTGACYQDAPRP